MPRTKVNPLASAKPDRGRNRRAFDQLVSAVRETGKLEAIHEHLVASGRTLADALDDDPRSTPSLWTQYADVCSDLRSLTHVESEAERALARLLDGARADIEAQRS